jgi:hypothetical protein
MTREQAWADPPKYMPTDLVSRADVEGTIDRLTELRARCQRYTSSIVTPMGDEMFYRYQEALIDDLLARLGALFSTTRQTEGV